MRSCLICWKLCEQRPIALTSFYEVVFDMLKIVCASVYGLFGKFWAKNVCWHPKECIKIVAFHLYHWIEGTRNVVWLFKCCIWNWSPFCPLFGCLSIQVRTKNCWIGMHMSGKWPVLAGVGLILGKANVLCPKLVSCDDATEKSATCCGVTPNKIKSDLWTVRRLECYWFESSENTTTIN
jgi:hypothetical protein